jgi:very-short-patch-repair endonuclease
MVGRQGFAVLRFPNSQISQQPETVLADILLAADPSSGPSGHLLPQGEKGG